MMQRIKKFFSPSVDGAVQHALDQESINSIHRLCLTVIVFELIILFSFVFTRSSFDRDAWISLGSVVFCIVACMVGVVFTGWVQKGSRTTHKTISAFKILLLLVLSGWAIWVSWRHYTRNDELLTFFAVELMMVCFIPLRPWISIVLMAVVYGALYAVLYSVDHAARVNIFNYVVLTLVSMAGMVVRYYSQLHLSEKTIELQRYNAALEHLSRHDGLTGLRNRMALDEDAEKMVGETLSVYMIDIDYFKEINDQFGHSVGDEVLRQSARRLKTLFPVARRYRYGGDEFLVISSRTGLYGEDTYRFSLPEVQGQEILLAIGAVEGAPRDHDQLFALINDADAAMYRVKLRTHSPEFGGHESKHTIR